MWELQRARNTDRRCAVAIPCSAAANSDGKKAQYYPRQVRARCARRVMKEQQTWHNKLAITLHIGSTNLQSTLNSTLFHGGLA
jgi:hypothetical protein